MASAPKNIDYGAQAFRILQAAFVIVPILMGADKFFSIMEKDWLSYLSPFALHVLQGHGVGFMKLVGIVEIVAGVGVLLKPKFFSYIVAAWLLCITLNLLAAGGLLDIAVRDLGLFLGALALCRLSQKYAI